ncbi:MAG: 2-oxo acid dehydrogenase subunit E2 [Candidatus Eremiobacteraeota bacterium]|nr:2-oxo acid dehydrogenase subunit E2 [Candidatus Eremiobacteraeota bacterium]
MALEFKLPELGENIESAEVLDVLVSVGDTISTDTPVLEIETDKATIEVPSDVSGVVKEVLISAGQSAKVGQTVLRLEAVSGEAQAEPEPEADTQAEAPSEAEPEPQKAPEPERTAPVVASLPPAKAPGQNGAPGTPRSLAPAAPSTRRLAREIGVDINLVPGHGPGGRISIDDVKTYAKSVMRSIGGGAAVQQVVQTAAPMATSAPLPDFSKWGEVRREKMSGIRRKTAQQMSLAWTTIPQVTQFDKADITALEGLRKQINQSSEAKITVTAILLKVMGSALKKFPNFNASIDLASEEIVYKDFYNVGVAVDTERGLLVPVVHDVVGRNIAELANELNQIAEKARNRKIGPDDLQGSCITITNLGGIGGYAFSPIVNPPEVAILGVARASMEPVFGDGRFRARLMMPLCLSYDHRLIDGADAARFLRWICEALENPALLAFEG